MFFWAFPSHVTIYFLFRAISEIEKKRLTLMNSSMLGSLSEFCRSAISSQKKVEFTFSFLKFLSDKAQWLFTHTPKQISRSVERELILKCCSGSQEAVRSWMSAESECDTSQGCLGSVRGLLGGYRSEHTFTSQGREGGSRDDGRGARSFIPGAKLNEERA